MPRVRMNPGIIAICVLAIALAGCGKKDGGQSQQSEQQASAQAGGQPGAGSQPTSDDYAKMAEQNRQTLTQMNQGKAIESMSGEALKALLPADVPGMKRIDATAERNQAMGFDISEATGQYSAGENGESNLRITLTDTGNMSGPMRMGMVGWTMAQINRETDNGYEKTITYKGYKGLEEYNKNDKNGTVRLFVAERFLVEVEGDGVTIDTLKQALDKLDLAKLSSVAKGS